MKCRTMRTLLHELWKTQTYRRKVIDDMPNNKDTVGSPECTQMKNADHRSCAEH